MYMTFLPLLVGSNVKGKTTQKKMCGKKSRVNENVFKDLGKLDFGEN